MLAIFDDGANRLAPKVIGLYIALIAANLLVWVWAFTAFHSYPLLLATALIAHGWGCGTRSTRITLPRSTTSPAN